VKVGAAASYYGNRHLQEEQSRATARGIARVLTTQLLTTQARLELSMEENRLILPDPASTVSLSTDDEQLLAANLDADSWTSVTLGLLEERFEQEESEPSTLNMPALEANAGRRVPLSRRRRERDQSIVKSLQGAIEALEPLAGS